MKLLLLPTGLALALAMAGCGDDSTCNGPLCVSPGEAEAARLAMGTGDGQTGAPGRALKDSIDVIVTDDQDRAIEGVEVTFTIGQGSTSDTTVQSDIEGRARVSWTLGPTAGSQTAQATAATSSGNQLQGSPVSFTAQAVQPPPARLVIRTEPSDSAQNGVPFAQQPVIQVLAADSLPIPEVQVTAALASGGGTLNGTTSVTSDPTGLVTYADLALVGTKGPRTIGFTVSGVGLETTSGIIQLEAGTAAEMTGIAPLTYQSTVTSPVTPAPSVRVKDAAGNPVAGVPVSFTPDRDASVSPTSVASNADGIAQVTAWTLGSSSGGQYTLTARVDGSPLPPVVFTATARPGAAGRLRIVTQPAATAQSGVAMTRQPVVQIVDQNGNPTPQRNVEVEARVSSGPGGALRNASVRTDGSGAATFSGLALTGTIGNYTLSFSANNLAGANSDPIALSPGAPSQLALLTPATLTGISRQVLSPQPSFQVQDGSGNAVAQAGITVIASLAGDGTLGGTAAVPTDATGKATFTDLAIIGPPGTRTLNFSAASPVLEGASVQVTFPAVASVELSTFPPASAPVASPVTPTPVWILKDAAGNPVADVPVTVTTSDGGTALLAPPSTSDAAGQVQLSSWNLSSVAGDQFVEVAVAGGGPSAQAHIEATPAAPVALALVSGDNQTVAPGAELAELLIVRLVDQYQNGVGGATIQWRTCDGAGDFDDITSADGYSSATQTAGPDAGTFCVRATAAGLGFSVDFHYTVTPPAGASTQLRSNLRSGSRAGAPAPTRPRSSFSRPTTR